MASIRTADHESIGAASPADLAKNELADDDPRIWGWHHSGNGGSLRVTGVVVAIVLALMAIGNHEGHIEDIWLFVIAALLLVVVLISTSNRRKSTWRK